MRTIAIASLVLLGFVNAAQALPGCPSPTDLNLAVPTPVAPVVKVKPLISSSYMATIEGEACQSVRNGVEGVFIKAEVYHKITLQPARTYRYVEVRQLASEIYARTAKCRVYVAKTK
jgi:hypothetical protein